MRAVLLLLAIGGAGCFDTSNQCTLDDDCSGGSVCANTHDCVPAGTTTRVQIRWTVRGNAAGPDTCAPIPSLEIAVLDDDSSDRAAFAPVPCAAGVYTFDKLPDHFDRVALTALASGERQESAVRPEIGFDLTSGEVPVDGGVPVVDAAPPDAVPMLDAAP